MRCFHTLTLAALLPLLAATSSAAVLTDITLFSANSEGNNWNGLLWNTQGVDTDPVHHYKLYVSANALGTVVPSFINHGDDITTRVALPLSGGAQTYSIYGGRGRHAVRHHGRPDGHAQRFHLDHRWPTRRGLEHLGQ